MVTSPHYTDIPATGDIDRAPVKTGRKSQQDEPIYFMLSRKSEEENETGDHATITLNEAAKLLNISIATVKLWSDMGLLQTSMSPGKGKMVRLADILTFLPEDNRAMSFMELTNDGLAEARLMRQERQKLAKMNVRTITELTKQSVSKISHLGGRPPAGICK